MTRHSVAGRFVWAKRNRRWFFAPPFVRRVYDRRAPSYDRFSQIASLGQDARIRQRLVRELRLPPGGTVVSVGHGTGRDEVLLAQAHVRIVAVDASAEMLRRAGARMRIVADAAYLPFAPRLFDGALATYLVGTVDAVAALEEMERVVRSGGRIVVSEDRLPAGWYFGPGPWIRALASVRSGRVESIVMRWMGRRLAGVRRGSALFGLIFWASESVGY